jgi:hypothetical protein
MRGAVKRFADFEACRFLNLAWLDGVVKSAQQAVLRQVQWRAQWLNVQA